MDTWSFERVFAKNISAKTNNKFKLYILGFTVWQRWAYVLVPVQAQKKHWLGFWKDPGLF